MSDPKPPEATKASLCVLCRRGPATPAFHPFCSRRCADLDLARWLGDGYRIPGRADDPDEDAEYAASGERTG
jgi:hypothetical protein